MKKHNPTESLANLQHEYGEHDGVNMSIEASTTFMVKDAETLPALFEDYQGPEREGKYLYGRHFNPTVFAFSKQMAALEGTQAAYASASGMSAISSVIMLLVNHNEHIIASQTLYGGTYALLKDFLPIKTGIQTDFVDVTQLDKVEAAINENTKCIFAEALANPTLSVADIRGLADIAHRHNIPLIIDNTFTPLSFSPAQLGADVVIHSLTKFISGASDIIGGVICAKAEVILGLMDLHTGPLMLLGPTMDPRLAFEMSLRIPHLALRIQAHSQRAHFFAERLNELGVEVNYPGLSGHPGHSIFSKQMNEEFGYGGMLGVDFGTEQKANEVMSCLQNHERFGCVAVSLGYFDTLMSCSASSTSSEMCDKTKAEAGISPGYVRFSMGYTGSNEQRWDQLMHALKTCGVI